MNEALTQLYESKWNALRTAIEPILSDPKIEIKPANPLLLYVGNEEEYKSADIKLMIFGQETNSWYDKRGETVDTVQNLYDEFFNGGECWEYGGAFLEWD